MTAAAQRRVGFGTPGCIRVLFVHCFPSFVDQYLRIKGAGAAAAAASAV